MNRGVQRRVPRAVLVMVALGAATAIAVVTLVLPHTGNHGPVAAPSPELTRSSAPPVPGHPSPVNPPATTAPRWITSWAYQLQNYPGGRLDALARGPYQLTVVDLARDAHADYFTAAEIKRLRGTGKKALAYFEIGSIEHFRPEYPVLRNDAPDLIANEWKEWPGEYFVRYWDERWWRMVIKPRVDQALRAGFDGVYLDTPLAYEQIDRGAAQGRDTDALGQAMTNLIARISAYAKAHHPGFLIVPQNAPELRKYRGYTGAVDGIAMEELFFLATDRPCTEDWCGENLAEARALRDAGKFVLSVDYATQPSDVRAACSRYRSERFAGTVTVPELDRLTPPCA